MSRPCGFKTCIYELKPGSKLRYCHNCRASMSMWANKKRPAELVERRRKLSLYGTRMALLSKRSEKER